MGVLKKGGSSFVLLKSLAWECGCYNVLLLKALQKEGQEIVGAALHGNND